MAKTFAYLRVSSNTQDINIQKIRILGYARSNKLHIDEFIEFAGSRRPALQRLRVEELLGKLSTGDTLIVAELARLGRSLGEIFDLLNGLMARSIGLHAIAQGLRLSETHDMWTKFMIAGFRLMAELEKGLISDRTRAGIASARVECRQIGRAKGFTGKSMLDGRELQIEELLRLKVTKVSIAKICGCSLSTLDNFIKSRGLKG